MSTSAPRKSRTWLIVVVSAAAFLVLGCIGCGIAIYFLGGRSTTSTTRATPMPVVLGTLRHEYNDDSSAADDEHHGEWVTCTAYAESPTPGAEPFFVLRDTPAPPTSGIPVPIIRCIGAPGAPLPGDGASVSIVGHVEDLREADEMMGMVGLRWLENPRLRVDAALSARAGSRAWA